MFVWRHIFFCSLVIFFEWAHTHLALRVMRVGWAKLTTRSPGRVAVVLEFISRVPSELLPYPCGSDIWARWFEMKKKTNWTLSLSFSFHIKMMMMMMTQGFPHKVPSCLALQQTFVKVKIRVKDEIGQPVQSEKENKEIKIYRKVEASTTCCQMYKEEKTKTT